jgi:hypothetical protein
VNREALQVYVYNAIVLNSLKAKAINREEEEEAD